MTSTEMNQFRTRLKEMATRIRGTANSIEEQARQGTGGEAIGDLSHTPMHLADLGSEICSQELGATLLENEQYLQAEIDAALERITKGTFGMCENCKRKIVRARLSAIPYARYCMRCAAELHAGRPVNMNDGRPESWEKGSGLRAEGPPAGVPGGPEEEATSGDSHAAGTPGGGSAVGGLAGTNIGAGEPEGTDLEQAMGSGTFDVLIEGERTETEQKPTEGDDSTGGYAGHSGGAVGGTPANKRATGGKR